jgi:hypothetical protein
MNDFTFAIEPKLIRMTLGESLVTLSGGVKMNLIKVIAFCVDAQTFLGLVDLNWSNCFSSFFN